MNNIMDLSQTNLLTHQKICQKCNSQSILITKDGGFSGICAKCGHLVYHLKCHYVNKICSSLNPKRVVLNFTFQFN